MFDEFDKINGEVAEDLKINDLNLFEKTLRIPHIKHFWVGKLIKFKIEQKKLLKKKNEVLKEIGNKFESNQDIPLSKSSALKVINDQPQMKLLNERLEELEILIEYLEKVEKIFSQTTFDIKNIVELQKMEQL